MRAPFWLKLAAREMRASGRRLAVYMGAITLGVAALVAINSFRAQVVESVDSESKALLGADLRISSNRAFPDSITGILDSASTAGVPVSRVTTALTVALTQDGAVRLAQVRAVAGGYPFYGEMVTEPAGLWSRVQEARTALAEQSLMEQLGAEVGDSIRLGAVWFEIRGVLTSLPPELSFRNAVGPRVYISERMLDETGLLRFGSIARYEAYLQIRDDLELQQFVDRNHAVFSRAGVGFETAAEQAEDLAQALENLGRFLGLVGLSALLLGGLGVASAVNVFVKEKRRTVAVLRCLGATQRTAFGAYLLQATLIGSLGALLGALLGVGIQALLPRLIGTALPITVPFAVQWDVVAIGVATGALVAATFALLPLLAVRGISPLRALRHDVDEPAPRFDPWRIAAFLLIIASVAAVSIWQARLWQAGLLYAGALIVGMGILWICARLLILLTRRVARTGAALARRDRSGSARRRAFTTRQGIANLYRPRNQTAAVTMSLGFGVFLVATLWVVQQNLLSWLAPADGAPQPNLIFFDIQRDQLGEMRSLMEQHADAPAELVPIVPARLTAINGRTIDQLLEERPRRVEPWALRREYRHTYRDTLTSTETLVEGAWFDEAAAAEPGIARVSIEQDVARNLDVSIGDRITWDITGVSIESVITSLRTVDWARFETNFFFVFEPGVLEQAPQSAVSLVAVQNDSARAALQREAVQRFPNISVVDIATVQRVLRRIIDRVTYAIRFMAAFSVGAGTLVLFGAIAASRFQRVRESALLRALGATRAQVRRILLVEYAALGALAGLTGVLLAGIAGWLLTRFVFSMPYTLPIATLALIWLLVTVAAALLGMLNSREALRSTPLTVLREADMG
ncbi:MAG TPA: FtsX-like permease family protein [Longimicrobiales bacterium]|nr:FtsX-like permease family protein [Longimicrobiales bacterium]